jgi:hypothetical protein
VCTTIIIMLEDSTEPLFLLLESECSLQYFTGFPMTGY